MTAVFADPKRVPPFQEISKLQAGLTQDDRWRTHFYWAYGLPVTSHLQASPQTAKALQSIPGLRTAMLSCLAPGKELPIHRGPYRGLLRVHLGLDVPSTDPEVCGLRVADETRGWQEGQAFVFDDTLEHAAWNRTNRRRVVLFLDILRPLKQPARSLNAGLIRSLRYTPYGRRAMADFHQWYENQPRA